MDPVELTELYRARWRRFRAERALLNAEGQDFAAPRQPVPMENLRARFLALPPDPEGSTVTLDANFVTFWRGLSEAPVNREDDVWGRTVEPAMDCLVRGDCYDGHWESYLSVHRSGVLDWGLTRKAGSDSPVRGPVPEREQRWFFLTSLVGRIWSSLALQGHVVARTKVQGPWQLVLALRGTAGSGLCLLGDGWEDPPHRFNLCQYPHVLLAAEVEEFPAGDAARDIAIAFGDRIENAWSYSARRHLNRTGNEVNQFGRASFTRSL